MNILNSKEDLLKLIDTTDLLLCFFTGKCFWGNDDLLCKVDDLLTNYPKVKSIKISIDEFPSLCAEFSVFIAPTILLFTQGKETLRESRFIVMNELDKNINRYYSLIF